MMKKLMMTACLWMAAAPLVLAAAGPQEIEIVFDVSRSMNDVLGNETRLEAAKKSLVTTADQILPGAKVGLRVFGATPVQGDVRQSCFDSQLVMPIGPFSKSAMITRVMALQAFGQTPLGYSLELAAKDFSSAPGVEKTIILISDGEESCGKNPVAVVQNLKAQGIDVKVHAIGFGVDARTKAQLEEIAKLTGGSYQDAQSGAELKKSLEQVGQKENLIKPAVSKGPAAEPVPAEPEDKTLLLKAQRGKGKNILAATEGGRVEQASLEEIAQLIDGDEENAFGLDAGEFAVFSFQGGQPVMIEGFAVPVREKNEWNPALITLEGSAESPERGFMPIAVFSAKDHLDFKNIDQTLEIQPPVPVKFLKIIAGPSVTGGSASHSEWKVFGRTLSDAEFKEALGKQTEKEHNLISKDSGGVLVASSDSEFEKLIDGRGSEVGDEAAMEPGFEGVFAFRDQKIGYVSKIAVPVYETRDTNCRTFEVSGSKDSPSAGFGSVQTFQASNMVFAASPFQEFKLNPPIEAVFLKVKIVDAFAADYCYLPELRAIGTFSKPAGFDASAAAPVKTEPAPAAVQAPAVSAPDTEEPSEPENPAVLKTEDETPVEGSDDQAAAAEAWNE